MEKDDYEKGRYVLHFTLTRRGAKRLTSLTRHLFGRGRATGIAQHFALVAKGRVLAVPQIDPSDARLANGLTGRGYSLTGFSRQDARRFLDALRNAR